MENKERKVDVLDLLITFGAMVFIYFLFFGKTINADANKYNMIISALDSALFKNVTLFIYIIAFFTLLIIMVVGFVIYKIIFSVLDCRIDDRKLLMTMMLANAASYLIGYLLIGIIPNIGYTLISNVLEIIIVFGVNYKEIKERLVPALAIKGGILIVSLLII
ncbi:MAG: hypothetical protein HUJ71_01075 [Pseudobutyrivibrio sp.]|nr:hypothetical protein [Pseudobutyrivibrio sp.]